MNNSIIDLRNKAASSKCEDLVTILREAHIFAFKLGLEEFDQWISWELNGYPKKDDYPEKDDCPEYREIACRFQNKDLFYYSAEIKERVPILFGKIKLIDSIPKILESCRRYEKEMPFSYPKAGPMYFYSGKFDPSGFTVYVEASSLMDIAEKTQNAILNWTLKLEKNGILGKNMEFNDSEKQKAKNIPRTVNNYFGATNIINSSGKNMQITSGDINMTFSYDNCDFSEIENTINKESLKDDTKNEIFKRLTEIKNMVSQNGKPRIIKPLLDSFMSILKFAGVSLDTIEKVKNLFSR